MRTSVLLLLLSIGGCSQYEMMYSGQVRRTESVGTVGIEEAQPPLTTPPKATIRGDCKATVWISEIHADPKYVPDRQGEYIELYNPNNIPIRLNGWRISDQKRDGHTLRSSEPIQMAAQSYFVLGINANQSTNGDLPVNYQYQRFNLSNTQDSVRLEDACGKLIQEVMYPAAWGLKKVRPGFAMELMPSKKRNTSRRWKRARNRLKSGERGTPGTGPWPITHQKAGTIKPKKTDKDIRIERIGVGALRLPE